MYRLYPAADPNRIYTLALKQFEAAIQHGGLARGSYTVFANDREAGEIIPKSTKLISIRSYEEI